jgi:hypothetical protein
VGKVAPFLSPETSCFEDFFMRIHMLFSGLFVCGLSHFATAGQLVAVDSNRSLYDIDIATGTKTLIGTVSMNAGTTGGLARDPATGTIYLSSSSLDTLFTLDLATGTATSVGFYGTTTVVMQGLEWDSTQNTLWGGSNGDLFQIDPLTGVATQVGTSGLTSFTNLGYVPATDSLYATNSTTELFYSVDRATGLMTAIGPLGPASTNPNGIAYDTDNGVMYMVDNSTDNLCTIDLATGAATIVGSTGSGNLLGLVYLPDPPSSHTPFCFGDGTGTACPCANSGAIGNGCANSIVPTGANLAATGAASVAADTLVLAGSGMPNSSALYFQGTMQVGGGLGTVFGDGLRCVGGTTIRLGTQVNVGGASQYPAGADLPVSVRGMCAPGDVRMYQVWYRNAAAFCNPEGFNLSNGVEVTWTL